MEDIYRIEYQIKDLSMKFDSQSLCNERVIFGDSFANNLTRCFARKSSSNAKDLFLRNITSIKCDQEKKLTFLIINIAYSFAASHIDKLEYGFSLGGEYYIYDILNELFRITNNNPRLITYVIYGFTRAYVDKTRESKEICKDILNIAKSNGDLMEYVISGFNLACIDSRAKIGKILGEVWPIFLSGFTKERKQYIIYQFIYDLIKNYKGNREKGCELAYDILSFIRNDQYSVSDFSFDFMCDHIRHRRLSYEQVNNFFSYTAEKMKNSVEEVIYGFTKALVSYNFEYNQINMYILDFLKKNPSSKNKIICGFINAFTRYNPEATVVDSILLFMNEQSINFVHDFVYIFTTNCFTKDGYHDKLDEFVSRVVEKPDFIYIAPKIVNGLTRATIENSENYEEIIIDNISKFINKYPNITSNIAYELLNVLVEYNKASYDILQYMYNINCIGEDLEEILKSILSRENVKKIGVLVQLMIFNCDSYKSHDDIMNIISSIINGHNKSTSKIVANFVNSLISLEKNETEIDEYIISLIKKHFRLDKDIIFGFVTAFAKYKNDDPSRIIENILYIKNIYDDENLEFSITYNFILAISEIMPNNAKELILPIVEGCDSLKIGVISTCINHCIEYGEGIYGALKKIFPVMDIKERLIGNISYILTEKCINSGQEIKKIFDGLLFFIGNYQGSSINITYEFAKACFAHGGNAPEKIINDILNITKNDSPLLSYYIVYSFMNVCFINKKRIHEVCGFAHNFIKNYNVLARNIIAALVQASTENKRNQQVVSSFVSDMIEEFPKMADYIVSGYVETYISLCKTSDELSKNILSIMSNNNIKNTNKFNSLLKILFHHTICQGVECCYDRGVETFKIFNEILDDSCKRYGQKNKYAKGILFLVISKVAIDLRHTEQKNMENLLLEKYNIIFCDNKEKLNNFSELKLNDFVKLYNNFIETFDIMPENRLSDYLYRFCKTTNNNKTFIVKKENEDLTINAIHESIFKKDISVDDQIARFMSALDGLQKLCDSITPYDLSR